MIRLLILSLFILTNACSAQQKKTMKTFDIDTFNKKKNHLNNYSYFTNDSTFVEQSKWQFGFEEIISKKDSLIKNYYKYYEKGNLKLQGDFFPNDFEKGKWKEYDEDGNLIKETDYDAPYKFTWEDILAFIKEKKINMNGNNFEITRNIVDGNPVWSIIHNIENSDKLNVIGINGITGKVFHESKIDVPMEDDEIDGE